MPLNHSLETKKVALMFHIKILSYSNLINIVYLHNNVNTCVQIESFVSVFHI